MKKSEFRKLAGNLSPSSFLSCKDYLRSLYFHLKKHIDPYTWPLFANDLGFSPSNIIQHFVKGRRPLTEKSADRTILSLKMKGLERRYFLKLVEYENAKNGVEAEASFRDLLIIKEKIIPKQIDKDLLSYYSVWQNIVISEMIQIGNFDDDYHAMTKFLAFDFHPEKLKNSLDLLKRLGIIYFDANKKLWKRTKKNLSTGHEATGHAVAHFHQSALDNAKKSISVIARDQRDFSSSTLCLTQDQFQKIKMMIHQFQSQALSEEDFSKNPDKVYQLNIQFFPVTTTIPKKGT